LRDMDSRHFMRLATLLAPLLVMASCGTSSCDPASMESPAPRETASGIGRTESAPPDGPTRAPRDEDVICMPELGLPVTEMPYELQERVWAAYPCEFGILGDRSCWWYGKVGWNGVEDGCAMALLDPSWRLTHPAFVHAHEPPTRIAPSVPVVVATPDQPSITGHGRILSVAGETLTVAMVGFASSPWQLRALEEVELTEQDVETIRSRKPGPGAPVVYSTTAGRHVGMLLRVGEERTWFLAADWRLTSLPSGEVSPVDVSAVLEEGMKVLAQPMGGSGRRLVEGTITGVLASGVQYEVQPVEGDAFTTLFTQVVVPQ